MVLDCKHDSHYQEDALLLIQPLKTLRIVPVLGLYCDKCGEFIFTVETLEHLTRAMDAAIAEEEGAEPDKVA